MHNALGLQGHGLQQIKGGALAALITQEMAEPGAQQPIGDLSAKKGLNRVGDQNNRRGGIQAKPHSSPAPAGLAQHHPEAQAEGQQAHVFAHQGQQQSGRSIQPAIAAPNAQQQAEHQHRHGAKVVEVLQAGANHCAAGEVAQGDPAGDAFIEIAAGQFIEHQAASADQADLNDGQAPGTQ